MMEGITYLLDDKNQKVVVQIDLMKHGEIWEDFYDSLIVDQRKDEENIPLEEVIQTLEESGKLSKA